MKRPEMSAAVRRFTNSTAGRALQAAEATARRNAMATRRPVTIASATTPTFTLVAEPDGQFQGTNSLQPTRFKRDDAWVSIDTKLRRGHGGTWVPVAVPSALVLSDGGSGPVATLTAADGTRTFLRFPSALRPPAVSGSTATYRAADGQTLSLTVTIRGGLTEAATVPPAAAVSRLRGLRPEAAVGVAAARAVAGTWSVAAAEHGAFDVTSPVVVPAGGTSATNAAATAVATTVTPAGIPACTNGNGQACDNNGNWTEVEAWNPDPAPANSLYDVPNANGYGEGIGNNVYSCSDCIASAYFEIPLNQLNGNMYVQSASLYETENYGSDWGCSDPWSAQLWWTGTISASTDYDNQPSATSVGILRQITPAYNPYDPNDALGEGCPQDVPFSFDVSTQMEDATADGWSNWTVRIDGDETPSPSPYGVTGGCAGGDNGTLEGLSSTAPGYNCGWMQISTDPEIITTYDENPPAPQNVGSSPEPMDYPNHDDQGCGSTVPYLDDSSPELYGDVYGNWSSEPVKGLFSMYDYNFNYVNLPDGGWAPSAMTAGKNQAGGTQHGNDVLGSGDTATMQVTGLTNGDEYTWYLNSEVDGADWGDDGYGDDQAPPYGSYSATYCTFIVDTTAPNLPVITGVTDNSNGSVTLTLFDNETAPTSCGFSPCFSSGIYDFEYSVDTNQFAAGGPTNSVLASGDSSQSPEPGNYTGPLVSSIQASSGTGLDMCLDDYDSGTTAGTEVDISNCSGSSAQKWTYQASTGELQIQGLCAGAAGNGTANGTVIELETCSSTAAGELWTQGTDGSWVNENSGACLTDAGSSTTPGTQQVLYTCNSTPSQDWGNATASITVTPQHWGSNMVYIQAQTYADAPSSTYSRTFYAPSPVCTTAYTTGCGTPGDVTGDGIPDLLATTGTGNLYVYAGVQGGDTLAAPTLASAAGQSPDQGTDWNDFLITHRGSLTGNPTDDLYAYSSTDSPQGVLWRYTDADTTAGAFPSVLPYSNSSDVSSVTKPASDSFGSGYDGISWKSADLTQILAIGNPDSQASPPGLLTVEDGNLWYYPAAGGGTLDPPTELGTGWTNMTLIAPGYDGPQNQLVLWARDNTTGDLYSYQFSEDGSTWTLSTSGTATPIAPEGTSADTEITLPAGVPALTQTSYPTIASAGDAVGPAALYLVDTSGNIWVLAGNPKQADAADPLEGTLTEVGSAPSGTTIQQVS